MTLDQQIRSYISMHEEADAPIPPLRLTVSEVNELRFGPFYKPAPPMRMREHPIINHVGDIYGVAILQVET